MNQHYKISFRSDLDIVPEIKNILNEAKLVSKTFDIHLTSLKMLSKDELLNIKENLIEATKKTNKTIIVTDIKYMGVR